MSTWRYAVILPFLMSVNGCIEITTHVSPSASGTVTDAVSQKPIQGATISVDDHPGLFAQTNSEGQFLLLPATRKRRIFCSLLTNHFHPAAPWWFPPTAMLRRK